MVHFLGYLGFFHVREPRKGKEMHKLSIVSDESSQESYWWAQ